MKLFILLLISLYFFQVILGDTCKLDFCKKPNEQCSDDSECPQGHYCSPDGIDIPRTCRPFVDLYGPCDGEYDDEKADKRCFKDLRCIYNYKNNRTKTFYGSCRHIIFGAAGEECDANLECYDFLECKDDICTLPYPHICSENSQCPFGQRCSPDKCVPITPSMACEEDSDCMLGDVCSKVDDKTNQCIPAFSKKAGDLCLSKPLTSINQLDGKLPLTDCNIALNLQCNQSGICSQVVRSGPSVVCGPTTDCLEGETCVCSSSSSSGQCVPNIVFSQECQDSLRNLTECAMKYKCKLNYQTKASTNECLYKNCRDLICTSKCIGPSFIKSRDPTTCGNENILPFSGCRDIVPNHSSILSPPTVMGVSLLFIVLFILF